jgi:hypothetical protein
MAVIYAKEKPFVISGLIFLHNSWFPQHTMDAGISLETQDAVRVAPFKLIRGQPSVA